MAKEAAAIKAKAVEDAEAEREQILNEARQKAKDAAKTSIEKSEAAEQAIDSVVDSPSSKSAQVLQLTE